jgi:hypothetical protein
MGLRYIKKIFTPENIRQVKMLHPLKKTWHPKAYSDHRIHGKIVLEFFKVLASNLVSIWRHSCEAITHYKLYEATIVCVFCKASTFCEATTVGEATIVC